MILVTGASGSNGTEIVKRLSGMGAAVRAMVRTPSDQAKSILPGMEIATADFDQLFAVRWKELIARSLIIVVECLLETECRIRARIALLNNRLRVPITFKITGRREGNVDFSTAIGMRR